MFFLRTLVFSFFLFLIACTNYSSRPAVTAPPLLVSATNNGNGNFTVRVRATNPELVFQGYRLYTGTTESQARNPADINVGTDCTLAGGTLTLLPVQPIEYTFEIDPATTSPASGVACRFRLAVTSGQFISVRSLGVSIQVQSASNGLRFSGPSNSILLP